MTNNVADHHPANSVAEGNHEGDFGCSMVELRNLMELRSAEAVARLNDSYGGVQNVCKRLKTSPVEGKRPSCGLRGGTTRSGPAGAVRGSCCWLGGEGSNRPPGGTRSVVLLCPSRVLWEMAPCISTEWSVRVEKEE